MRLSDTGVVSATAMFGLNLPQLTELMASFGQKPYRARQLFEALYRRRMQALEDITTLSQELRDRLHLEGWAVGDAGDCADGDQRGWN